MRLSRRTGRIQRVRRLMLKRSHKVRRWASNKRILEDSYSQEGAKWYPAVLSEWELVEQNGTSARGYEAGPDI